MRKARLAAIAITATLVAGCSLAPVIGRGRRCPSALQGTWAMAGGPVIRQPAAGDWWNGAHDAELSHLEARVDKANPDLAATVARYDEASAFLAQTRAGLFPQVGIAGSVTTNRESDNRPLRGPGHPAIYGSNTLMLELDYDLDLWRRVHKEVAASKDLAQASAADMESVRLSLHAELADVYFALRGDDEQLKLLRDSESAYGHALKVTTTLFRGGVAPLEDMTRARTNLYTVRAQISDVEAQRALSEHAIASLIGVPAPSFSIPPDVTPINFDAIPVAVPSTLLQRRPDIAAAQRRIAAANASIGIARAAFFPDISLTPMIGFQDTGLSNWPSSPNLIWAVGPSLAATLFDAGLHEAQLTAARAKLDESAATYRSTMLRAFQEVEDNRALLSELRDEAKSEDLAVQNAQRTLQLAFDQYQAGAVSYLDVFDAQTAALQISQSAINLRTRYLRASIGLVSALGGGWSVATDPAAGGSSADRAGEKSTAQTGATLRVAPSQDEKEPPEPVP